jgi:hypothetical protein
MTVEFLFNFINKLIIFLGLVALSIGFLFMYQRTDEKE